MTFRIKCLSPKIGGLEFALAPRLGVALGSGMIEGKITPEIIRSMKGARPIAALTAYDYPMTRLLDEAGIPFLLVGDSLGMIVLGHPDTTRVTIEDMEHHVRAAARARPRALLAADLPYQTYETPAVALENSRRLMGAGAEAVKAEGGRAILDAVSAIVGAGIPFVGHIGMLPQHIAEEGRYRVKGRTEAEHEGLVEDARALAQAGAFAVVLELVLPSVAREITEAIPIPTIGIGSGPNCDGQILVTQDLAGLYPWFTPKHVTPRGNAARVIQEAAAGWAKSLPNL